MQFMAISVGVLAIVGTLLLLFGRVETRKILGRLFASVAGLAIGAAAAMLSFYYGIGHTGAQSIISALGVANTWLVVGASVTVLLLIATVEARTGTLQAFVVPVFLAAYALTGTALEINSMPAQTAKSWQQDPVTKTGLSDSDIGLTPKSTITNALPSPTPCPPGLSVWSGRSCDLVSPSNTETLLLNRRT